MTYVDEMYFLKLSLSTRSIWLARQQFKESLEPCSRDWLRSFLSCIAVTYAIIGPIVNIVESDTRNQRAPTIHNTATCAFIHSRNTKLQCGMRDTV